MAITVPGADLSLWNSRDIFDGTRVPKEKLAVFIDAIGDEAGVLENIGCCFLQSEGEDVTKMEREFNTVYGPVGLLAPKTLADAAELD